MLAHSDLQRSIRAMTLGLMGATRSKDRETVAYRLAEREQQFQYEFTGQVGLAPVEKKIDLNFSVLFVADSGNQRDSTLDRPQVRLGFEEEYAPPGTIAYGKIVDWIRDADFNFIGATVLFGVHCPLVQITGMNINQARFKIAFHVAFQGFGALVDADAGNLVTAGV